MKKETIEKHIQEQLQSDEELIGFFTAQQMKWGYYFLIGPLALLTLRTYAVAVTSQGVHFLRIDMLDRLAVIDFFEYSEITSFSAKGGTVQRPVRFTFFNGRSPKIKAQLKGVAAVPKLTPELEEFIRERVS